MISGFHNDFPKRVAGCRFWRERRFLLRNGHDKRFSLGISPTRVSGFGVSAVRKRVIALAVGLPNETSANQATGTIGRFAIELQHPNRPRARIPRSNGSARDSSIRECAPRTHSHFILFQKSTLFSTFPSSRWKGDLGPKSSGVTQFAKMELV